MRRTPSLYRLALICSAALPAACLLLALGCESERGGNPTSHPGDAVLRDPMGYKMNDWPTVSGGGIGDFDKKAFLRDLNGGSSKP